MPIEVLSEKVASQIAAGEVVERPASVVKELLENSLDAGASSIQIRIQDAGKRLIEIQDDGSGISARELPLAVARHATSKLQNAEQLNSIRTLGFRGEALASIASVSQTMLISKQAEDQTASRISVDGAASSKVEKIAATTGTTVRVENLFSHVPARLKFLKSDSTERQQIYTLVSRYALAYPQVRFHLEEDQKLILQSSGNGNRREILSNIYGVEIGKAMLEVSFKEQDISIEGFISPIGITRSNRKEISFFINGRWIHDAALNSAITQAYSGLLMVGRFPMAALFIQMPAEMVDVNVHPAKAEVRFSESSKIFSAVQRAVRRAVLAFSPVPEMQPSRMWATSYTSTSNQERTPGLDWQMSADIGQKNPAGLQPGPDQPATFSQNETEFMPLLRLIGQIGGTYLVAEGPDGLYLIDQHAAHERVLFEKLIQQRSEPAIQPLLQPETITLPPHQAVVLEESLDVLTRLGFVVEEFGNATFRVRAVPALFTKYAPAELLRAVVEDSEEDETPLKGMLEAKIASRVCKRAAVKGGTQLALEEQVQLLRNLEQCQSPRTCPHGRPTMIHLPVEVLERQFGRRGSR